MAATLHVVVQNNDIIMLGTKFYGLIFVFDHQSDCHGSNKFRITVVCNNTIISKCLACRYAPLLLLVKYT